MKHKMLGAALAALLAATTSAQAQELKGALRYGAGLKDYVPAPIPVPAAMPVPEGFTYYLRADLGWSFAGDASFSESGAAFGLLSLPYSGLSSRAVSTDDVFIGTVGMGIYMTPRFRGDLTLDFRSAQTVDARGTYADVGPIAGVVTDSLNVSRVVGLVNGYWDLMPRGSFTPYVGAGIGIVYNDIERVHLTTDDTPATPKTGSSKGKNVGLAAALMAGASFAIGHQWALDVSYRALYLDGGTVTTTLSTLETSKVTLGDLWEHQVRVGVRLNIW